MTAHDVAGNKAVAREFIEAIIQRDMAAMQRLLHRDFVWITAVVGDDDPNELRPMQSKELRGKNLPHGKPRLNREEALTTFRHLFQGGGGDAMRSHAGEQTTQAALPADDGTYNLRIDILGMIGEGDRVAMEAESNVLNPANGRRYNNFYCYVFRLGEGKILMFKEYQDTLHLYDYMAD
jgi:ketosteroid isomerase-like protein